MRTFVAGVLLLGIGVTGCASPARIAEGARRHSVAASDARAVGDYWRAAGEQQSADRQWAKACSRARAVYAAPTYLAYCAYR